MDRRKFLSALIGGVAATAAVRSFPFRVFSFPKEVKLANVYSSEIFYFDSATGLLSSPDPSFIINAGDFLVHPGKFVPGQEVEIYRGNLWNLRSKRRIAAVDYRSNQITLE